MIIKHKLGMELDRKDGRKQIDVMQDDKYSRELELYLRANGKEYCPPEDCMVLVRYKKPDGQTGAYDTMPDGSKAWKIQGNVVTVGLAPQVCTAVGMVMLTVTLRYLEKELSCFAVCVNVWKGPGSNFDSEPYYHIKGFIPQPDSATEGEYIKVVSVDEQGYITAITTDKEAGKSAYEYATEAGYEGTEAEFAAKLASESSGIHIGAEAPTDENVDIWIDTDEEVEEPKDGEDGATFTPSVSADGVISWTNNRGLNNPEPVNIRGKDGKSAYQYAKDGGYTGTEAEFAEKLAQENAGGGQSDWNAAEGEAGHVLNRTHYENGTETKTLFDTTVAVANNQFQLAAIVPLVLGNTYTVTWDGTEYVCVAFTSNALGFPAPALGNPYFSGGENNGMPFGFISSEAYGQCGGAAMTNGNHTIKITEEVKAYKKLDECYLPSGLMPYILKVKYISLVDGVPSSPLTNIAARFDVVAETLWNGGRVVLDFTETELVNNGFYKAEVAEWLLLEQSDGTYVIVLWYFYKGSRCNISINGGTWTPPTA